MLKIRKEQVEVFEKAAAQQFEDRMVVHLTTNFSDQSSRIGDK